MVVQELGYLAPAVTLAWSSVSETHEDHSTNGDYYHVNHTVLCQVNPSLVRRPLN